MEHYYQNKLTECYLIFGLILLLPRIRRFHRALIMTIQPLQICLTLQRFVYR